MQIHNFPFIFSALALKIHSFCDNSEVLSLFVMHSPPFTLAGNTDQPPLFLYAQPAVSPPLPAGGSSQLTLKPMSPFLQQRQAIMRKMKVKRPEKETATTARDEGHDSSLSGAPSATPDHGSVKIHSHGGDEGDLHTREHTLTDMLCSKQIQWQLTEKGASSLTLSTASCPTLNPETASGSTTLRIHYQ